MQQVSLTIHRNQATILLKNIRKGDETSLSRIRSLDFFSALPVCDIQQQVQLKHALNVISIESGFDNWSLLKADFEERTMKNIARYYIGGHINHWFAHYDEAHAFHIAHGGFLLPYQEKNASQYYICNKTYIEIFGFNPDAKEWKKIAYDLVKPRDAKAWLFLLNMWVETKR